MALDYSLTYAGVPFVLDKGRSYRADFGKDGAGKDLVRDQQPEADLIDELDRQIPFHYLQDFTLPSAYPGRNLGAMAYPWRVGPMPSPEVHIGDWYYPNGANRWSVFRGLATSSQVKAMLLATGGATAQTFVMEANPISPNNPNNTAANYTLSTLMYMLPPRPLAEHGGAFDGLYLITLVDERYFWQYSPISIQVNANSTWAGIINQLALSLGVTIKFDQIPAVYQTPEPDSQFWTNQESAAALLDAVAYNVGCVVCRNMDGTYNLRTAVASQVIVNNNRLTLSNSSTDQSQVVRIAGGDIFNSGVFTNLRAGDLTASRNSVLPASVNITFPKYIVGNDPVPHMVNQRIQAPRPSSWFEQSYGDTFVQNVPLLSGGGTLGSGLVSGLAGISGYAHAIHTTAKALFSGEIAISGGTPLNQSGLTSLALQLAADFYNGQIASALDEVYPGTFAWAPEGFHDIIWGYSARTRQAYTRVMRGEWNQIVREMQHSTPSASGQSFLTSGVDQSGNPASGALTWIPPGVGGPSVAQTIQDSWASGLVGGTSGTVVTTFLGSGLGSGDSFAILQAVDYLPTQNRWWAQADGEIMLMEGTSGGISGFATGVSSGLNNGGSGYCVSIVYRGVRGTTVGQHSSGIGGSSGIISLVNPNAAFGINLTTYEQGQFIAPAEWTSGGIQGVHIIPQVQNVKVLDTSGTKINGQRLYSGIISPIDTTQSGSSQFLSSGTLVWAFERNGSTPAANNYYLGNLLGYSASGPVAPVYAFNVGGGGGGGGTSSGTVIRIGITGSTSGVLTSGFIQNWTDGNPPAPNDGTACWAYDLKGTQAWSGYYQGTFLINHSDGVPIYGVTTGPSSGYMVCIDGVTRTVNIAQGLWTGAA